MASEALSASDIESIVNAFPDFLSETKCPSCNSSDASIYVEDLKHVKYCSRCDILFGIDDSMNVNDLRQLMEEGRVKTDSCACGNDDVNAFLFEECQQSGKLYLKCMKCNLTKDIEIIPSDVVMNEATDDRVLYDDRLIGDDGIFSAYSTFDDQIPRQRYQPFTCECGNEENELFEKVCDASGTCLISVRCWNCDRKTKQLTNKENYCLIECDKCGNNMEDLFDKTFDYSGQIVGIFCHVCETHLQLKEFMKPIKQLDSSEPYEPPLVISYKKTKVTSLGTLKRGDHIAWDRRGGIYSHHGIVFEVLSEKELDVIHNTVAKEGKAANGGAKCRILKEIVDVDLSKGDLYLCNYKRRECLEPDEVIARAERLLGEKNYNLLLSNCEHFATFCKTARCFSSQSSSFIDFIRGLGSCSVKVAQDAGIVLIALKLQKIAIETVVESTTGVIGRLAATSLTSGVKTLSICGTVVVTLAVEGIVFGVKTYNAFKEYKERKINWKTFCGKTVAAGCLSVIRFACTSIGGMLGQLLIPVPFVGGLIGCTIGAILGDFIGEEMGNLCGEAIKRKVLANER